MRGCDLDTRITTYETDWEYRPSSHKNEHYQIDRIVVIGRRARAVLEPFLRANPQDFLFSPADVEVERLAKRHMARKTPQGWGNVPRTNRTRNPKRRPRDWYTVASLRRAIERGCELAFEMPRELHEPHTKAQRAADTPEKRVQRRRARQAWHRQHVWVRTNSATLLRPRWPSG